MKLGVVKTGIDGRNDATDATDAAFKIAENIATATTTPTSNKQEK